MSIQPSWSNGNLSRLSHGRPGVHTPVVLFQFFFINSIIKLDKKPFNVVKIVINVVISIFICIILQLHYVISFENPKSSYKEEKSITGGTPSKY